MGRSLLPKNGLSYPLTITNRKILALNGQVASYLLFY